MHHLDSTGLPVKCPEVADSVQARRVQVARSDLQHLHWLPCEDVLQCVPAEIRVAREHLLLGQVRIEPVVGVGAAAAVVVVGFSCVVAAALVSAVDYLSVSARASRYQIGRAHV